MRYHRADVVRRALAVLDQHGLADLSMRRLGAELGVAPSALYWHFPNKQSLLAAVADQILEQADLPDSTGKPWRDAVLAETRALRGAMLGHRDGAELIATIHAFELGTISPAQRLTVIMAHATDDPSLARVAANTLVHFVFGAVVDEQTQHQASSVGVLKSEPEDRSAEFELGLSLILDGFGARRHGSGA
ncbi:Tetracyclin repressor, C-terminal all-alpha domain [Nakamurella panacisegetis]|uniref:Tetracyclin repressor, C-terminal all-alpha domain n=1 Tax=Nakamurella panacisegetis TaxID=1090615 RepID=A0A1H0NIK8_9ACTN|nr:TetR family transcriptional regulator [Nakamurella panacisegetis]SDO92426.1 Tetracyclin repressor, C-terminal all-alpha domain [Nakamurella panacisegetis]